MAAGFFSWVALSPLTSALESAPGRNSGTHDAATWIPAPVAGLRAVRAGRSLSSETPKPPAGWLVPDKVDITAGRRGPAGAEAVLKLRALYPAGGSGQYGNHHLRQEHQRIYQATYRDSLQLAA